MPVMTFEHRHRQPAQLRWIYVDFNSYFASVEQQLQPHLRGHPVIVVPVDSDYTSAIAASYEAKAYGIGTGTAVHEAKRLCRDLICVPANHEAYVDFHHRIRTEIERHIPISEVCSIDEVACRLMDNETSTERATEIALSIKRGLAEQVGEYITCSIGIAPNKYLAKIAGEMQKPDGLVLLPLDNLPGPLLSLTLRDLPGVGRNMEERLHRKGIASMATLWQRSPQQMRQAWGSVWGERIWHLLRGAELEEEETRRHSIGHSHVIAPEHRPPDKARQIGRRLTLKAASRLRRMHYCAALFSLGLRMEDNTRYYIESACPPAQDSLTFLRMLDIFWQGLTPKLHGQRIKKISITLSNLHPAGEPQMELLGALPEAELHYRKKWEKMSQALDRINQKYGRDSILLGVSDDTKSAFTGSKIAFTRIPDKEEFRE